MYKYRTLLLLLLGIKVLLSLMASILRTATLRTIVPCQLTVAVDVLF